MKIEKIEDLANGRWRFTWVPSGFWDKIFKRKGFSYIVIETGSTYTYSGYPVLMNDNGDELPHRCDEAKLITRVMNLRRAGLNTRGSFDHHDLVYDAQGRRLNKGAK